MGAALGLDFEAVSVIIPASRNVASAGHAGLGPRAVVCGANT